MKKKQTAVKYLVKEFSEILGPLVTQSMQDLLLFDAINKAKEMERIQIIDASATAYEDMFGANGNEYGENYYNKKFNN